MHEETAAPTGREVEGRWGPEHIVETIVAEGLHHLGAPLVAPVALASIAGPKHAARADRV